MAYDKKKIYKQAEEVIKKHNLYFVEDIVAYLPCGRSYFWETFPKDSDEMDTLKELLEENKVKKKSQIRAKLGDGTKASELLALYRLICTPEERQMLNQQYIDHSTKGNQMFSGDMIFNVKGEDPIEE